MESTNSWPKRRKLTSKPDLEMSMFDLGDVDHTQLKDQMREVAAAAVDELPAVLKLLTDTLRTHDPLGILTAFTFYGLTTMVGSKSVSDKKLLKDILPHHAELLQALVLAVPFEEWGTHPLTPSVMQTMFDTVPKLADIFFFQRVLEGNKISDAQQFTVLSLQERIRMHTHAVRNWGYFGDVIKITLDLYAPLDQELAARHGFTCTEVIKTMAALVPELERRQTEHWNVLRKVAQGRTSREIFDLYYKHVPSLVGTGKEMADGLRVNRETALAMVMSHFDLRLEERANFTPAEVGSVTGQTSNHAAAILKAIALKPGSLAGTKEEYLFLGNPIWHAPVIDLEDRFFIPMPQAFFSHIHRIMEKLVADAGLKEKLEKTRNVYLESGLEKALASALPGATVAPGAKWKIGAEQFETDALVIIDRTVLIAEAKANRLTPEGLRGAPDRVKRHVREMVLEPSTQSARLADVIVKAKDGDAASLETVRKLGIDTQKVDQVIRISVTLDDLSVLSASVGEFKKAGWVPTDHQLAPTILLSDLLCVIDILDNPLLLLHYLAERIHLQESFQLLGDELDFLGLYLASGFNIGKPDQENIFSPSGMSAPIDKYYNSRDAGVKIPKPTASLSPYFRQIVSRLCERRPEGWTTTGIHLLSSAGPSEQRAVERQLHKLRKMVRRNFRDPKHANTMFIAPPVARKGRVGFYLFPEELRGAHRETMTILARSALAEDGVDSITLFGRSTEQWGVPYESLLLAKNRE